MNYENLLYEKKDRIATVTLNRPEHLNAFSPGITADLTSVLDEMEQDEDVLVAIITGAGRGFSSGAFIRGADTHALNTPTEDITRPRGRWSFPWDYPKPLIAAVNGAAYGGGLNLALCCDIIIASTEARFCFPMSKLGVFPPWPGTVALTLFFGKARVTEMALMARPFSGEDAYRWGLANKVVAPQELMEEANAWAREIAGLAPVSVRLVKEELRESWEHHFNRSANRLRFMATRLTSDREEGHRAWSEKRAPVFTGR